MLGDSPPAFAPVLQQTDGVALHQLRDARPHTLRPVPPGGAQPQRVHHLVTLLFQPPLRLVELDERLPRREPRHLACQIHLHTDRISGSVETQDFASLQILLFEFYIKRLILHHNYTHLGEQGGHLLILAVIKQFLFVRLFLGAHVVGKELLQQL